MNSEQFAYWLQGYLEVSQAKAIDEKQVQIIKDHLALVFNKKTPDYSRLGINPIPALNPNEVLCMLTCSNNYYSPRASKTTTYC